MTINRVASWLTCVATVSTVWSADVQDAAAEQPLVSVVTDRVPGPAAVHGLDKLTAALSAKGGACEKAASLAEARGKILIVAGLAGGDGPAARLLQTENHPVPVGPEALVIRRTEWQGKRAWVIAGSDDRGLMYGELDVADRIGWSTDGGDPLAEVREAAEMPVRVVIRRDAAPRRSLALRRRRRGPRRCG